MIATMLINKKKLNSTVNELLIRGTKLNISLFLFHNIILLCYKDILHTILLSKLKENERFNKPNLIIHQILALKTYKNIKNNYHN